MARDGEREIQRLRDELAQAQHDLAGLTRVCEAYKHQCETLKKELVDQPRKNAHVADLRVNKIRNALFRFEAEIAEVLDEHWDYLLKATRRDFAEQLRSSAEKYTELADRVMEGLPTRAEIIPFNPRATPKIAPSEAQAKPAVQRERL